MSDLAQELRDLTAGQPAQLDRSAIVRTRVRRRRRRRGTAGLAVTVAVLLPLALVLTRTGPSAPAPQVVTADFAHWPDRSQPGDEGPAAGALAQYRRSHDAVTDVHWLYRGRVAMPVGEAEYVAVWWCLQKGEPVLVTGTSKAGELGPTGQERIDGKDIGVLTFSTFPQSAQRVDHVGVYLHYPEHAIGGAGDAQGISDGADDGNALFVLADPTSRALTWRQEPLLGASADGLRPSGALASDDGVFFGDIGKLAGPVSIDDGRRTSLTGSHSVPSLAALPAVPAPDGLPSQGYQVSQTMGFAGSELAGGSSFTVEPPGPSPDAAPVLPRSSTPRPVHGIGRSYGPAARGRVAVNVRCSGGGTLHLALTTGDVEGPQPADVWCDGAVHEAFRSRPWVRGYGMVLPAGTRLQAYAYNLGASTT